MAVKKQLYNKWCHRCKAVFKTHEKYAKYCFACRTRGHNKFGYLCYRKKYKKQLELIKLLGVNNEE